MKNIKYIVTNEIYYEAKNLLPKPIKNYIPEWYKKLPMSKTNDSVINTWLRKLKNVKSCPSFIDIYKEGYVLLAPTDIKIWYDKENEHWVWRTPYDLFPFDDEVDNIAFHENDQMVNYLPTNSKTRKIFKIHFPMVLNVPNNYNIRVMPVPFHYNNDWVASPGVYNPNKVSQVNLLIEYTSNKDEILIQQGTPLAVHIPYKKEKFNYQVEKYNAKKHNKYLYKNTLLINGKFHSSYLRNLND